MNDHVTAADIVAQTKGHEPASEATHIEQSRAIAQVQGALVVAQQKPRDQIAAAERMREVCQLTVLAENAFFRYSRGGSQITGPSIHLATELARCWGNIDFGITELRRDDRRHESEMLAHAWDLETNARVVNSFIVPHRRDTKNGPVVLMDVRDIYENNANLAARRLRECIFRVLPKSFIEEAKTICTGTLERGGGEPIEKRRANLLEAFASLGVTRSQVEKKIGRSGDKLTAFDIGALRVVYGSIKRGEATVDDEFPADRASQISDDLRGKADEKKPAPKKKAEPAPEAAAEPADAPAPETSDTTDEPATADEAVRGQDDDGKNEEVDERAADEEPDAAPPADDASMFTVELHPKPNSDRTDWVRFYSGVKRMAIENPDDIAAIREANDSALTIMSQESAQNYKSLMAVLDKAEKQE